MRIALLAVLVATPASAHIIMTKPTPRTQSNKSSPCGGAGSTRGSTVTTFAPGATITVEWDETVDHPGHYRISFDDDGQDFTNPSTPDDNFAQTLMEPIADKAGGHYTQDVTLPMMTCENCTLQLIQVMTTQVPYNSFYFQCADIRLADDGGSGSETPPKEDSGGCAAGGGGAGAGAALALVGLVMRRRRR